MRLFLCSIACLSLGICASPLARASQFVLEARGKLERTRLADGGKQMLYALRSTSSNAHLFDISLVGNTDISLRSISSYHASDGLTTYIFVPIADGAQQMRVRYGCNPLTEKIIPMRDTESSIALGGASLSYKKVMKPDSGAPLDLGVRVSYTGDIQYEDMTFFTTEGKEIEANRISIMTELDKTSFHYHLSERAVASIAEARLAYYPLPYHTETIPMQDKLPAVEKKQPEGGTARSTPTLRPELLSYLGGEGQLAFVRLSSADAGVHLLWAETVYDEASKHELGAWVLPRYGTEDRCTQYRDTRSGDLYFSLMSTRGDEATPRSIEAQLDIIYTSHASKAQISSLSDESGAIEVNGEELRYRFESRCVTESGEELVCLADEEASDQPRASFTLHLEGVLHTAVRDISFLDGDRKELKLSIAPDTAAHYDLTREEREKIKYIQIEYYPTPYETKRLKIDLPTPAAAPQQ